MLSLEAALEKILGGVQPLPDEIIPLGEAFGRFAAKSLNSAIDLPPADNSAMDGYAVQSADLVSASAETPVALSLSGSSPAGTSHDHIVRGGHCIRIFTGALLPRGADAVIMQEDTKPNPDRSDQVLFLDKVCPWENIRLRGEDLKQGADLIHTGEKFTAPRLNLLAATGMHRVRVFRQPVIGLLATGDELRKPGNPLDPGTIYESNQVSLSAFLRQIGAVPKIYSLVPDSLEPTCAALQTALNECDAIITTGGVSVGELDWVKMAFEKIGGRLDFWKVEMRPGKPFVFGRWKEKFLFGLPGNPVSAMVTFFLLARPALLKMQGAKDTSPMTHPAILAEPLANNGDRRHFMRVSVDAKGQAKSSGVQAAHILSAMSQANGLVDVPPQTTLPTGATVQVMRWD